MTGFELVTLCKADVITTTPHGLSTCFAMAMSQNKNGSSKLQ